MAKIRQTTSSGKRSLKINIFWTKLFFKNYVQSVKKKKAEKSWKSIRLIQSIHRWTCSMSQSYFCDYRLWSTKMVSIINALDLIMHI